MKSLLGHGEANRISPLLCALECDYAERKTRDTACELRLFVQSSDAKSMDRVCRGMASPGSVESVFLKRVSQFHSSLARSLLRGLCDALRALHRSAFRTPLQSKSGPCSRMHGLALGSRAHSHRFAKCDPSRSGIQNRRHIMYQNKAILIGFLGGDAEVRTGKNNQKFTTLSLATKTLLQGQRVRRVHLAYRMASFHRLRQARRVCGHAQEGRAHPDRRRDSPLRVHAQEGQEAGPHRLDSRQLHPQARPRGGKPQPKSRKQSRRFHSTKRLSRWPLNSGESPTLSGLS